MTDFADRRSYKRISVNVPVKIHIKRESEAEKIVKARILNIYGGGSCSRPTSHGCTWARMCSSKSRVVQEGGSKRR